MGSYRKKQVVEKDRYTWPTIIDLDDEFNIFDLHVATSSLINPDGKIIFSDLVSDKVRATLDSCFN